MAFVSWDTLRTADLNAANGLIRTANSIRNGLCEARRTNPVFRLLNANTPFATPGLRRLGDAVWNSFCPNQPPITNEERPLGGQCPVQYGVIANVFNTNGTLRAGTNQTTGFLVTGPVRRLYWEVTQGQGSGGIILYNYVCYVEDSSANPQPRIALGSTGSSQPAGSWNARLIRSDGQPDNCGDPPPIIPPIPQPNITNITIPVTLGDVTVPLTLNFGDINVNNWPDFEFRPTFDTQIGPIRIGIDGIELPDIPQLPEVNSPTNVDYDLIGDIINTDGNTTRASLQNAVDTILDVLSMIDADIDDIIDLIRKCCCKLNAQYTPEVIASGTEGGTFTLPLRTVAVIVNLQGSPTVDTPMQSPSGTAPAVYYWGWMSVNYGDADSGDRKQLQFRNTSFPCFEYARSVTVNPTRGNIASVVALYRSEEI